MVPFLDNPLTVLPLDGHYFLPNAATTNNQGKARKQNEIQLSQL